MALAPFIIRVTGDSPGTLDEVKVRIELVDPVPVQQPEGES